MPAITTAEDAVNTAEKFLSRYHALRILQKVVHENDKWVLEFDVGALTPHVVHIVLDAQTGSVIEYTREQ